MWENTGPWCGIEYSATPFQPVHLSLAWYSHAKGGHLTITHIVQQNQEDIGRILNAESGGDFQFCFLGLGIFVGQANFAREIGVGVGQNLLGHCWQHSSIDGEGEGDRNCRDRSHNSVQKHKQNLVKRVNKVSISEYIPKRDRDSFGMGLWSPHLVIEQTQRGNLEEVADNIELVEKIENLNGIINGACYHLGIATGYS